MAKKKSTDAGRPPVPAALARGKDTPEYHARKTNVENNLLTRATLAAPKEMSPEAKKEWRRLMRLYKEMPADILSNLDITTLILYCEHWSIYRTAQKEWAANPTVVGKTVEEQKAINENLKIMNKQAMIIAKFTTDLCLNPVGRAKMGINPADKKLDDKLDNLFSKFGE